MTSDICSMRLLFDFLTRNLLFHFFPDENFVFLHVHFSDFLPRPMSDYTTKQETTCVLCFSVEKRERERKREEEKTRVKAM